MYIKEHWVCLWNSIICGRWHQNNVKFQEGSKKNLKYDENDEQYIVLGIHFLDSPCRPIC